MQFKSMYLKLIMFLLNCLRGLRVRTSRPNLDFHPNFNYLYFRQHIMLRL